MYKLIRLFAPVVLVLFFCGLFAGPGWAKEGDVTTKVEMPDIVNRGETFTVKIVIQKEDSSGNKTPIIGAGSVTIEATSDFILKDIERGNSESNGEWRLKVKAPKTDGKYQINVLCLPSTNVPDSAIKSYHEIKVMLKSTVFLLGGTLLGAYYGAVGGLAIKGSDGTRWIEVFPFGSLGAVLAMSLGIFVGTTVGSYTGQLIDDAVTHNEYATNILYPINYPLWGLLDLYRGE